MCVVFFVAAKRPFLIIYVDNVFSLDDEPKTEFTLFIK